jgi:hypothetical protein
LARAQEAGIGVIRLGALSWRAVEPARTSPPTYDWSSLSDLETAISQAQEAGIQVILVVMFTPDWAQAVPGHSCGPIREDALSAFAQFLEAAVERYSQPPYQVRHWELWNEPDVDPKLVPPDSVFGCWGDSQDEYYGARAYALMLRHAYPAIKRADPGAQVIMGGLLLDAPDTQPSRFLEGILKAGGGDSFDALAFHGYTTFSPRIYNWDTITGTKWIEWGGVVQGKTAFLRQTLGDHGYEKPLILNEAGLIWWSQEAPTEEYQQAKADYVVKLYTRGLALELANVSWYSWDGPGWRQMGLLDKDQQPTPAYHALSFATRQLGAATYVDHTEYPGLEGYSFVRDGGLLQVLWSEDGLEHPVHLPSGQFINAFDLFGQSLPPRVNGDEATLVVRRPLFLELSP